MKIRSLTSIPIVVDEPVAAIRQFAKVLRECVFWTEESNLTIRMVGISARAVQTIREFKPKRTRGAALDRTLQILDELPSFRLPN